MALKRDQYLRPMDILHDRTTMKMNLSSIGNNSTGSANLRTYI